MNTGGYGHQAACTAGSLAVFVAQRRSAVLVLSCSAPVLAVASTHPACDQSCEFWPTPPLAGSLSASLLLAPWGILLCRTAARAHAWRYSSRCLRILQSSGSLHTHAEFLKRIMTLYRLLVRHLHVMPPSVLDANPRAGYLGLPGIQISSSPHH